ANTEIGNVHGATLAVAVPVTAAKQLSHHQRQVSPLGDSMPVPAMGADDLIVAAQSRTYPHSDRFLANVSMHHPRDIASVKFFDRSLIEGTNGGHLAIHGKQLLRLEGHRRLLSSTDTLTCRYCTPLRP